MDFQDVCAADTMDADETEDKDSPSYIITEDETWVHNHNSNTKQQPMEGHYMMSQ
jgi:hypothetical protein